MKVLLVFADMIRANRLKCCNSNIKEDNALDTFFQNLWGTMYSECFSPAPDTPRWIACLYSWLWPHYNWCDLRIKYPKYYLNKDQKTFFDLFLEKGYKINAFANPTERETGLFPHNIDQLDIHNSYYDLGSYLSNITLEDNHMLFVSIPDFHHVLWELWSTETWEQHAYKQVTDSLNTIFKHHKQDDFDHIIIFSDHWFKLYDEFLETKKQPALLLNEDRINSLMFHKQKWDLKLVQNNQLISTTNLFWFIEKLLSNNNVDTPSLYNTNLTYFIWEDHTDFSTSLIQAVWIWYYVDKDHLYVRTLDQWYNFVRHSNDFHEGINKDFDEKIMKDSKFGDYKKRKEILDMYEISNKTKRQDHYANGAMKGKAPHPYISKLKIILYLISKKLNK